MIKVSINIYGNGTRYLGLSADTKPIDVDVGATFIETDTRREYVFDGTKWQCINQKTYEWLNVEITSKSFFNADVLAGGFKNATGFVASDGNTQISFRATDPQGNDYGWDILGNMNSASMRASCQADICGLDRVKLIVQNDTEETVTVNIYVYLGR